MIAASFGLSRASLYRLFEPTGGIAGYIRKRSLRAPCGRSQLPGCQTVGLGRSLISLGFKNISAFNRAFRIAHGISPSNGGAAAVGES